MGHRVTLSGHIQERFYGGLSSELRRTVEERNWASIQRLPEEDSWPFLPRGMFARSTAFGGAPSGQTTYRGRVLHFGGSFSSLFDDLDQWLAKFESLLRELSWEHAAVQIMTEWVGDHHFLWRAELPPESDPTSRPLSWTRQDTRLDQTNGQQP